MNRVSPVCRILYEPDHRDRLAEDPKEGDWLESQPSGASGLAAHCASRISQAAGSSGMSAPNIASSPHKETYPHGSPRGGGNEEPASHDAEPGPSQRTMAACCCGKEFATTRGMKIHRTKKGCPGTAVQRSPSQADCMAGEGFSGQEAHRSADDLPAQLCRTPLLVSRKKINWPKMSDTNKWDSLDEELLTTLDCLLEGPIQRRLQAFSDITYVF